ncbi:uncharacterized protein BP5553_00052 [Venustampulla echinocandica]|uniref:Uncharacterized protein n=1 Tax=Venustampulla echinocandica TaxID=2656787 RepID=A0A370TX30_9HELO|nr:uncharacterized protein BP5553_00052 [Venustampulla echinocandica]RDL40073.1 hypothetical protein BP5553_00052 [Venustampulla echinocandica]
MSTDEPVCPDWVFSDNSNVSIAKDRGWFISYTPFMSRLSNDLAVVGIGTVEIPVRRRSSRSGKKHSDILDQYSVSYTSGLQDQHGRTVAYFDDKKRLFCLKLSGPPVGPSTARSLFLKDADPDGHYHINAEWHPSEHARWEATKQLEPYTSAEPPYTSADKAWIKEHFTDEYHLLQQYGLKVYKDEDHEEGRAIVRTFIASDAQDAANGKV